MVILRCQDARLVRLICAASTCTLFVFQIPTVAPLPERFKTIQIFEGVCDPYCSAILGVPGMEPNGTALDPFNCEGVRVGDIGDD